MSYRVWKDSKAALILFIRSEGATEVIQKAQAALDADRRRMLVRQSSDTGLTHYMMKSSTDEAKLVDVALIPFVVVTLRRLADSARPSRASSVCLNHERRRAHRG